MGPNNNTMPSELENALTDQFIVLKILKISLQMLLTQFGSGWCFSKRY